MSGRARKRKFQAQTQKLLDMMIHSVYAQRDVFLRELISNASDAIDKVRFLALTDASAASEDDFKIRLIADAETGTLSLIDNGIGMSEDEVIENLGTIARSGSEAFRASMKEAQADDAPEAEAEVEADTSDSASGNEDAEPEVGESEGTSSSAPGDLIGQFGVGFYSVFMVADKVTVVTQRHGEDHAVKWVSTGGDSYMIQRLPAQDRGTKVTLQLKREQLEEADDEGDVRSPAEAYTDPTTLRSIIKKHSDYIAFPIVMDVERSEVERDEEGQPVEGAEPVTSIVEETLNSRRPLWTRRPADITEDEHGEFYRHLTHDWSEPFQVVHFHVEGMREYSVLVYLPASAPMDLYTREHRRGLQLYARRVFIMEECRELMPEYLRFARGLVDSPDLPLNLSRETVQQDRLIAAIRKRLTRRILGDLKDRLDGDREAYEGFWEPFGPVLKEGFHYEPNQSARLQELLLFRSTAGESWTSLAEYLERMPEGQEGIYYLSGDDLDLLRTSPQLEAFRKHGVEVLLMNDPVDELVVSQLGELEGHSLLSAARGDLDLTGVASKAAGEDGEGEGDDAEAGDEAAPSDESLAPLLEVLQAKLDEDIEAVRVSKRLTDSAVCLVAADGGLTPQLEQMMRQMGQEIPPQKRIMEINAKHPLTQKLLEIHEANAEDERLVDYAEMLLDQALLAEGAPLKNPARFAQRVAEVMSRVP